MLSTRRFALYQVTALPHRSRASGLRWHAVPPVALTLVDGSGRDRRGLRHRLAPYRVTLVPSRTVDLTESRPAIAV